MIISIFNQKGGVAKTSTIISLGSQLSKLGKKVLIVDMDAQANATNGIGVTEDMFSKTIFNLLSSKHIAYKDINDTIIKTSYKNLYCIPSDISLSNAEISLSNVICREKILSNILHQIKDDYDYIIIDTPPNLGLLSINALSSADRLIIPISLNYFSIKGLKDLMSTYQLVKCNINANLEIMGVLITMYNSRITLSKSIKETLSRVFGNTLFKTAIRQDCQVLYSQDAHIPLPYFNWNCNAFEDYSNLAQEVLQHE